MPAVYIQSILGSRNDYDGVERLGYNRAINREKYAAGQIDCALEDKNSLRYQVYSALSQLIVLRRAEKHSILTVRLISVRQGSMF